MLKPYDIVGWTFETQTYCCEHKPEGDEDDVQPVFAEQEGWEQEKCVECMVTLGDAQGVT